MNILITAGGTHEPIDAVRAISNSSTGRTGAFLAEHFAQNGANVTLLRAANAAPASHPAIRSEQFTTTASLGEQLQKLLAGHRFDGVIHAAAVSDYHVSELRIDGQCFAPDSSIKLSTAPHMELRLTRNPKLVDSIKSWSANPDTKLVAFKLTQAATTAKAMQAVQKLMDASHADYVLHNDQSAISATAHPFTLYAADGTSTSGMDKSAMAAALYSLWENLP